MKKRDDTRDGNAMRRRIAMLAGIVINVLLSFIAYKTKIPFYLDTGGTICIAMMAGPLPAMVTAVATSILCSLFNENALYYTFIGVLIALMAAWFFESKDYKNRKKIIRFILSMALIAGVFGIMIQWFLIGGPQFSDVADAARYISRTEAGYFFSSMLVNIGYNIIDKGAMAVFAVVVLRFLPDSLKNSIQNSSWKQKPLSEQEKNGLYERKRISSLKGKMTRMLILAALILTFAMAWISIQINFMTTKKEYTENAINAAKLVAQIVDVDKVEDYLREGSAVPGYDTTRDLMYSIRENSRGVQYLYVVKIAQEGCYFVFDLDTEDTPAYEPGEKAGFEEAFEEDLPALFSGEEIEPIESNDIFGWVVTAYYPIRNSEGRTVCYAGADVSMKYLSDYVRNFLIKTLLIFSGFFTLVLGYGLWISRYNLIYPIGSMTGRTKEFAVNSDDQKALDNSVKAIRELDIRTNDEVEELYQAICKMSSDMAEQVRSVRHFAAATAKMQNGLIITMADMVENRDSDTGAHIQKTAAYVRIILEGLRDKGYYLQKITPNYISDVEMSAPLHDVGKINISDAVLNKPGKLTDEEYEIMKTHTTAGKKIIEKAINTLQGENYLKEARNMAAYHHERWDGKGYPEKLHGEVIPLSARVMAVADVFDALASPRVYKPAFPFEKAVEIICEGSGTQFDPKVVEAFMDNLDKVKEVLKKYTQEL